MIDETQIIHTQVYDDEHEEWHDKQMTIAEYLDAFTEEGCPKSMPDLQKIKADIMAIGNWRRKSEIPNAYLVQAIEIIEKYQEEARS